MRSDDDDVWTGGGGAGPGGSPRCRARWCDGHRSVTRPWCTRQRSGGTPCRCSSCWAAVALYSHLRLAWCTKETHGHDALPV
jgi:hypothetical protein